MPLSVTKALLAGEVSGKDLEMPPQRLAPEQAEAFLAYVFEDVARKPAPLSLREGAATARYLQQLAEQLPDTRDRVRLLRQAQQLWKSLLDAPGKAASKAKARRFLDNHAETYLAGLDVDWLRSRIEEAKPSPPRNRQPPLLMSKRMSASGAGNPHLLDDLSERIHGAYCALRQSGIANARGRIAQILEQKKLRSTSRQGKQLPWAGDQVIEKVKQYERSRGRRQALAGREDRTRALERERRQAANKWIFLFRSDRPDAG